MEQILELLKQIGQLTADAANMVEAAIAEASGDTPAEGDDMGGEDGAAVAESADSDTPVDKGAEGQPTDSGTQTPADVSKDADAEKTRTEKADVPGYDGWANDMAAEVAREKDNGGK